MSRAFVILGADDAARAAHLHTAAFATSWSAATLHDLFQLPTTLAIGIEQEDALAAFISVQVISGEADIQTLAVHSSLRRQGLASDLLSALEKRLGERGVSRITLDVAEDNRAACALYRRHGYQLDGRRPDYYRRANEQAVDAVLMSRALVLKS